MPLCPSCQAEYVAGITTCPECQTALVDSLPHQAFTEDLVNIYVCYDRQVLEVVLGVLTQADLTPMVRDRSSSSFPVSIGTEAALYIAVPEHQKNTAITCLNEALEDGALGREEGDLL